METENPQLSTTQEPSYVNSPPIRKRRGPKKNLLNELSNNGKTPLESLPSPPSPPISPIESKKEENTSQHQQHSQSNQPQELTQQLPIQQTSGGQEDSEMKEIDPIVKKLYSLYQHFNGIVLLDTLPSNLSSVTLEQIQDLSGARKIDPRKLKKQEIISKLEQWRIKKQKATYYIEALHGTDSLPLDGEHKYFQASPALNYVNTSKLFSLSLWFKVGTPILKKSPETMKERGTLFSMKVTNSQPYPERENVSVKHQDLLSINVSTWNGKFPFGITLEVLDLSIDFSGIIYGDVWNHLVFCVGSESYEMFLNGKSLQEHFYDHAKRPKGTSNSNLDSHWDGPVFFRHVLSTQIFLGARPNFETKQMENYFKGAIKNVTIYHTEFSESDAKFIYLLERQGLKYSRKLPPPPPHQKHSSFEGSIEYMGGKHISTRIQARFPLDSKFFNRCTTNSQAYLIPHGFTTHQIAASWPGYEETMAPDLHQEDPTEEEEEEEGEEELDCNSRDLNENALQPLKESIEEQLQSTKNSQVTESNKRARSEEFLDPNDSKRRKS